MPLYRRADSPFWWYSFTVKGARFRGSCETTERELAEIHETNLKREAQLGAITGQRPRATLDEAFALYYDRHAYRLPSAKAILGASRTLLAGLGKATGLHQLTDAIVARFIAKRRGTLTKTNRGRDAKGRPAPKPLSDASINRELTLLRTVLLKARDEWGFDVAPIRFKLHMLTEPEPRSRYLSSDEAERLIDAAAEHLKPAIRFALLTGLRLSNIARLDWSQVDMRARQIAFQVKSRKPGGKTHVLPITAGMLVLLANQQPADKGPVFTYGGKEIGSWKRAWKTALKRAGISDFRFHDLRHTAASWMVQGGADLDVVQGVLGHEDIKTTQRYAHRDTGAKARAMQAAESRLRHGPAAQTPTKIDRSIS